MINITNGEPQKMAGNKQLSQRDETLVKVLDRLSENVLNHESLLEEILTQQRELVADMERTERRLLARQDTAEASTEKTHENILRYRSDLLSLVNEQDRLNEIIKELTKKQSTIAYTQDGITRGLSAISSSFEAQDRIVRDISTYSVKHEETLSTEIAAMNRSVAKLHMDTEKRLGEAHKETQRQLEKIRMDVERRLLALDKIEESLNVLLIRTEPPEKKPFFIKRIHLRLRVLFAKTRDKIRPPEKKPFILVRLFRRLRKAFGKIRLRRKKKEL